MKNQYFGDINDYFKYGILKCFAEAGFRIGVCWMLTPDSNIREGIKIHYLDKYKKWRRFDPKLFDCLYSRMKLSKRCVEWAKDPSILPHSRFYNALVPITEIARSSWFKDALNDLKYCDLIFFDPDRGIEVPSLRRTHKVSSKYVYWDELKAAWDRGASLLIFQHYPREKRSVYIPRMVNAMKANLQGARVVPLHTANVLYLLATHDEHQSRVNQAVKLIEDRWSDCVHVE
jgi:hypothetical protein